MIIKSAFRRAKGMEAHLLRNDTNERVDVRKDLFRGVSELRLALRLMDGISRSNSRVVRSFVHFIISPSRELDDAMIASSLSLIEAEFGIADDAPRAVVQHLKGTRPAHFHAVYSIVDQDTGRAIDSHKNFEKDELVSRRLEIMFGDKVIPGPRLGENITELRKRGEEAAADLLEKHSPAPFTGSVSRHDRRQAERLNVDSVAMSADIYRLFELYDRDLDAFANGLAANGYALCRGHTVTLVSQDATGFQTSLARCLRREAKAAGRVLDLREGDLRNIYQNLKPDNDEREHGFSRARSKALSAADTEWSRGIYEAIADADMASIAAFRDKRKKLREDEENARRDQLRKTLQERREAMLDLYKQKDDARRARVDRAFRAARLFDDPTVRRLAFAIAATGVLMTGAGLAAALLAAGVAISSLPTMRGARQLAARGKHERSRSRCSRDDALRGLNKSVGRPTEAQYDRRRFSFDRIDKGDRVLAGLYARSLLHGDDESYDLKKDVVAKAAAALGPEIAEGIARLVELGSPLQVQRLMGWYQKSNGGRAVAAALARHAFCKKPFPGTNTELRGLEYKRSRDDNIRPRTSGTSKREQPPTNRRSKIER